VTVETVVEVYSILQPTRMSGELCKWGLGLSPSRNDVWAFCTQFLCNFRRVLVHLGVTMRENNTKNTRKYNWGW